MEYLKVLHKYPIQCSNEFHKDTHIKQSLKWRAEYTNRNSLFHVEQVVTKHASNIGIWKFW